MNLLAELQKIAATYAVIVSLAPLESQASLTAGSSVSRKVNRPTFDCYSVPLCPLLETAKLFSCVSPDLIAECQECSHSQHRLS